ncbi:MAG: NADH:flavin oxidoreductase [Saccharopolyspora sp.]|uniref:NADH:flavin oxidoreductase n=1 Tax=Saccharopolyspora sp. TaxID=33915 RepID=UPI0025D9BDEC|nr:NADH:flavin oxidoreductase [Saccharopolyspora sp.]MBQ6640522.1 NADH:flavin oxidoreductase [Saccharopolyspora sp.]
MSEPQSAPDPLQPARLGPVTLRNRVLKAATFEGRTPKSLVSDDLIEFHRQVAAGGAGMTTVAYCAVSPDGRSAKHQLYWRPEALPGLRRLTDAVHDEGAAVSAQLGHAGPVAPALELGSPALSASRRLHAASMSLTKAASAADIDRIARQHAEAAEKAIECGFDAVELHFGHNYFISSFLSPNLNRRKDSYGGELRNRARPALQTARAVRDAVGDRIAVLAKLNMDDGAPGGFWVDEAAQVARWLEADGSVDAIELTAGSSLRNPMYLFRGDAPLQEFAGAMKQPVKLGVQLVGKALIRSYPYEDAFLLEQARQIRAAVRLPLVLLGGITSKETMDLAMSEGFQFVAMARALLREPDLINRIQAGERDKSLCIHCNKCMPTIYRRTRCVLVPEG